MVFADKTLVCRDCGNEFIFTAGEQSFYAEKGLMNEPRRCPECRSARRRERPRQGTTVTCASCGAETTVPFVPSQDRPVYCSACYAKEHPRAVRS